MEVTVHVRRALHALAEADGPRSAASAHSGVGRAARVGRGQSSKIAVGDRETFALAVVRGSFGRVVHAVGAIAKVLAVHVCGTLHWLHGRVHLRGTHDAILADLQSILIAAAAAERSWVAVVGVAPVGISDDFHLRETRVQRRSNVCGLHGINFFLGQDRDVVVDLRRFDERFIGLVSEANMGRVCPLQQEVRHQPAIGGGRVQEPVVAAVPHAAHGLSVGSLDAVRVLLPVPWRDVLLVSSISPVQRLPQSKDLSRCRVVVAVAGEGHVGRHGGVLTAVDVDDGQLVLGRHGETAVEGAKLRGDGSDALGHGGPELVSHHATVTFAGCVFARRVDAQLRLEGVIQGWDEASNGGIAGAAGSRSGVVAGRPGALKRRRALVVSRARRVAVLFVRSLVCAGSAIGARGEGRANSVPRVPRAAVVGVVVATRDCHGNVVL